jgi:Tfp pilus assembly protein FimT
MIGLMVFLVVAVTGVLSAFAAASLRWGVDSRTMTSDGRAISLFTR